MEVTWASFQQIACWQYFTFQGASDLLRYRNIKWEFICWMYSNMSYEFTVNKAFNYYNNVFSNFPFF